MATQTYKLKSGTATELLDALEAYGRNYGIRGLGSVELGEGRTVEKFGEEGGLPEILIDEKASTVDIAGDSRTELRLLGKLKSIAPGVELRRAL